MHLNFVLRPAQKNHKLLLYYYYYACLYIQSTSPKTKGGRLTKPLFWINRFIFNFLYWSCGSAQIKLLASDK